MPIELKIDHERRFATVQMTGTAVGEDLLGYFDALVAEGAMPYAKLVDARHATPAVSEQDMAAVADKVRSLAAFDPRGRAIETFATIDGARAWLASRSRPWSEFLSRCSAGQRPPSDASRPVSGLTRWILPHAVHWIGRYRTPALSG